MIRAFFTRNVVWKLLSLVVAFAIWMTVASEPELSTIVPIPVEYKNQPDDLEISSPIVDTVDVEARGPAGRLRDMPDLHLAAVIDFRSVTAPGVRTFTLSSSDIKLPRGLQLVRAVPAQLRFTFERVKTQSVPVHVPFSGTLEPGLRVSSVEVNPPELRIAGPESHVARTKKLDTDPFDLSRIGGDAERRLSVYADQPEVRFISKPEVRVRVHVERMR